MAEYIFVSFQKKFNAYKIHLPKFQILNILIKNINIFVIIILTKTFNFINIFN